MYAVMPAYLPEIDDSTPVALPESEFFDRVQPILINNFVVENEFGAVRYARQALTVFYFVGLLISSLAAMTLFALVH